MALKHEKRLLQKSEIALGREGTAEAAKFPEVRNEIVALKKLEQEQKEVAVRIAKIEEALKHIVAQREENSREQAAALARLEEEKRPLVPEAVFLLQAWPERPLAPASSPPAGRRCV